MPTLPRVAVGSIQPGACSSALHWGLLDLLERAGWRVQNFFGRACLACRDGAATVTGRASRHLDTWLMSPALCREMFVRGSTGAHLATLQGSFARSSELGDRGSDFGALCGWLGATRVAVVDAARLQTCVLPPRPAADAILIDRVSSPHDFHCVQTLLESLWGLPVVGGRLESPLLTSAIENIPAGGSPSRELCRALGDALLPLTRLSNVLRLASQHPLPPAPPLPWYYGGLADASITVAVAYDEAFSGYYPDTLDMLEELGVTVRDFSPLRDESLPDGTDIVYVGCGHPERFAEQLSNNECLLADMRNHLCAGRRLYGEGGGLGYLCQSLQTETRRYAMVGALPAVAYHVKTDAPPTPVEVTLAEDTWLGSAGLRLKGYLNPAWTLEPIRAVRSYSLERDRRLDLVGRHQAIGSRIHFDFAAQPACLRQFVQPHPEALAWAAAT